MMPCQRTVLPKEVVMSPMIAKQVLSIVSYAFSDLDGSIVALTSIKEVLVAVHALNKKKANPIDSTCLAIMVDITTSLGRTVLWQGIID